MRRGPATILLTVFLLGIVPLAIGTLRATSGSASAQGGAPASMPAGWTAHKDAKGFAMDAPQDWNFTSGARGQIVVRGPRGEQVVVWPVSIDQALNTRDAMALVRQLARQVDGQMPWAAAAATGGVVRTVSKGPQRSGTAVMTWSSGAAGTSVLFYCVAAPTGTYRSETNTFAAILRSFRAFEEPTVAGKPTGPITFVTWTEPRENSFSISVPQGWKTVGGMYRLSATDIRAGVALMSPDRQIRVQLGDLNLGTFIEPAPMMAYAGLREGMYYRLGDGSQLLIWRYLDGQQFARTYVQRYVSRECSDLKIASNNARVDLAGILRQRARGEGMPNPQLTAGDVSFTCTIGGTALRGMFVSATVLPFPGNSGLWYAYRLYGYLVAPGREQDAERVVQHAVESFRINPEWQAQQQQIANAAVAADNARSQQLRQRALEAIQEDQRQTSDMIMKGWEQRSQIYDEISRRRENAILGTVDVVDPESGKQYKIENYSDYHWMNNQGTIVGNNTGSSPGPDWRELVTLP